MTMQTMKRMAGRLGLCAGLLSVPTLANATPIASLTYVETALSGGLVQYDYTLANLGDPVADAGLDLYDLTIFFSAAVDYDSGAAPWDIIGGSGFVNAFSIAPGLPPVGTDVGPGQSLGGFRFVLTGPVGDAAFSALFFNPVDPSNPVVFDGTAAAAAPAAVPEPATLGLIGLGAIGAVMRRRRIT